MFGGVSRQPDVLRHATQVEEADNVLLGVRNGLEKRPGSRLAFALSGLVADANYRLHTIIRDENERYLMLYGAGTPNTLLRIFKPDGAEATVSISPAAQTYLKSGSPTADQLRPITIADYTLMLNTTVALAAKTSASYAIAHNHRDFDVMISQTPNNDTYHKTKADTAARTAGYFFYRPYDASKDEACSFAKWVGAEKTKALSYFSDTAHNPGGFRVDFIRQPMSLAAVTWNHTLLELTKADAFTYYVWCAQDQIYISGGTAVTPGWYDIVSRVNNNTIVLSADITTDKSDPTDVTTTNIGHEYQVMVDMQTVALADHYDVALQFQDGLRAAGCADGLVEWMYTGSGVGRMVITSPYRGAGCAIADPIAPTSG